MMARLPGTVYTSRAHPLKNFAADEWSSAERTRYLDELGRYMNRARAMYAEFDPAGTLAPPCKAGD